MKFFATVIFPGFVLCSGLILIPRDIPDSRFSSLSMTLEIFNEEHSVEELAKLGDLTIYKTSQENFVRYERTLSALFEIEKEQVYKVNWEVQENGFVLIEDVPWHLGRITSKDRVSSTFPYGECHRNKEIDIHSYIIDTGIDVTHPEFEGRAVWLEDFSGETDEEDLNPHATHCAGIIGAKTYGVCKDAKLYSVRVLDKQGSGSTSGVIAGIEYTFKRHKEQNKASGGKTRSIVSMSLGGGFSSALNRAVQETIKDPNFFFAAAAGNENSDACETSPASAKGIFTVMASGKHDKRAYFSNYGKCTDIYAPGVDILSTIPNGETAVFSGTSMACPQIVGVLNHYLDQHPELNMKQLKEKVLGDSTKDHIKGKKNSTNNYLVYLHREELV